MDIESNDCKTGGAFCVAAVYDRRFYSTIKPAVIDRIYRSFTRDMKRVLIFVLALTGLVFLAVMPGFGQTTAFSYQGRLTESSAAANGAFEMQFKMFDSLSGGAQAGSTIADLPVQVNEGIFAVMLDFGSSPFTSGADRFLEIAVRRNSGESYVTLAPRQQIASAPFAIRTISAQAADSVVGQTPLNTPNTVVSRNSSGDFSAGTITANLTGNASGNVLKTGDTMTGTLNLPANGLSAGGDQLKLSGGNVGIGTASPSSKLHVVGGPIIAGTNSPTGSGPFGHYNRDNAIVAWASVPATGLPSSDYNICGTSHSLPGNYGFSLCNGAAATASLVPFAIAEISTRPTSLATIRIVSVDQTSASGFRVYINDGNGAAVDNAFVFIVTGR
jgi:hypothetical protein